jgi:WD40 repeat protein
MDSQVTQVAAIAYKALFQHIKAELLSNADDFIPYDRLRDHMMTKEFEEMDRRLSILQSAPFKAAKLHLRDALTYLHVHDEGRAMQSLDHADTNAKLAFVQSDSFEKKVFATKLRVMICLHLNNYFDVSRRNMRLIDALLSGIWEDFIQLPEIRSAIRDEFESNMTTFLRVIFNIRSVASLEQRRPVLQSLAKIKYAIGQVVSIQLTIKDSNDRIVHLHDAKLSTTIKGHSDRVNAFVIYHDRLFSASGDNTIRVWDISEDANLTPSTKPIAVLSAHRDAVNALTVYNGKLFSVSSDNTIRVWSISDVSEIDSSLQPIATLSAHSDSAKALATYDGKLFSGSIDNIIRVWDVSDASAITSPLAPLTTLSAHRDTVKAHAIYKGKLLSGSAKIVIGENNLSAVLTGHRYWVNALAVWNGKLFSASSDNTIRVWDISGDESTISSSSFMLTAVLSGHSRSVTTLTVYNGKLFSGSHDQTIHVWDISDDAILLSSVTPMAVLSGHSDSVSSLAICNGKLFSGSKDDTIRVWDISDDANITSQLTPISVLSAYGSSVHALATINGKLYAGCQDGTIRMQLI